jgi:two-component system sensor histidine kinase RegB
MLEVRREARWLDLLVSDHGPGFIATGKPAILGDTDKQAGLGIGLALAEATADRLDGELTVRNTEYGAEMRLRLPLTSVADS